MLNFDPKQFLAESREGLATLATLAGYPPETDNAVSKVDPAKLANRANPVVSDAVSRAILRDWHGKLSKLVSTGAGS